MNPCPLRKVRVPVVLIRERQTLARDKTMASSLVPPTNRRRQDSQPCAFVNDPLVLGYYQSFHPAHPILLSLPSLRGSLARTVPGHVVAAVRYIGARYMQKKDVESTLYKEAARVLCSPQADGYHVQSRLLLAIAAHGNGEHEQAQQILDHTITMALNLGMHTAKFATEHANGSPALEDMWRRTFWELFAVDTLFGVLHERVPRLQEVLTDVPLPGDEAMYLDHEMACLLFTRTSCPGATLTDGDSPSRLLRPVMLRRTLGTRTGPPEASTAFPPMPAGSRR